MKDTYTYLTPIEREYQNKVLALFQDQLKYKYLGNFLYQQKASSRPDGVQNKPIIEEELKGYLRDAGYTEMQVTNAFEQLKRKAYLGSKNMGALLKTNNDFYEFLIDGAKCKPTLEKNEENVYFIDFEHWEKNRFAVAEEVSYIDNITGVNSRPDIVVYVNGIAVAVIELKRCIVSLREGIKQMLSNERELIPSFFTTVQFTIAASDGNGFQYGTINTPEKFWCPFKSDGQEVGKVLTDMESFGFFFDQETFIRLLRYGVVNDGGTKKVMRPHQYYALTHAIPRLKNKQSGVIWHSQGSGKSLTMIWLAAYIKANFPNPRVVVITDRTELDLQIKNGFVNAGESVGHAKSGQDLLDILNDGQEWLVCSLIHKFGSNVDEASSSNDIKIRLDTYLEELMSVIQSRYNGHFSVKGENIFVFIDECHRTQGGALHEAMRKIMGDNVMLIGFTGTPLLKTDKGNEYKDFVNTSEYRFGPFIHKYLHKEAVADKVILDLQYEARDVEQQISNKDKLDEIKGKITEGLSTERIKLVDNRWATLEKVYSSRDRIEKIAYSIIDDVRFGTLGQDWCNAMLIAGNIYSAYKYYEFFQNSCPDHALRNRCAVVTSYIPTDADLRMQDDDAASTESQFKHRMALQSYNDAKAVSHEEITNGDKYEAWAKKQFINYPGRLKLMIVVDKLLTGFDAPCATYLYIDKDMRDHGLFQALCRVNRLGVNLKDDFGNTIVSHKEYGLIVDFKHLFGNITEAVCNFNDENGALGNYDPADIEGLLIDAINGYKERLLVTYEAYMNLKTDWSNRGLTDNEALKQYYLADGDEITAEEKRATLYKITGDYIAAYSNISNYMGKAGFTTEEADRYEALAREASQIREFIKQVSGDAFDPKHYDPAMRELIDRFMKAEEATTIVPATADFSFIDLISDSDNTDEMANRVKQTAGSDKAAAEVIEGKARVVINSYKTKDPELFKRFSERLQEILDSIRANKITFIDQVKAMIDLVKEARGGGQHYPGWAKSTLSKALWNNRGDVFAGFDDISVEVCVNWLEDYIDGEAYDGWDDPMSSAAYSLMTDWRHRFKEMDEEQLLEIYKLAVANYR
ncbi:MAG: HsdR family type I site-specific deoxyribonuclease [Bacteroidales bacterium]|nr:HsdR family type I site-specific deoxyribonuclease [Bacteroidales bacterium]